MILKAEKRIHQKQLCRDVEQIDELDKQIHQIEIIAVTSSERKPAFQVDSLEHGQVLVLETQRYVYVSCYLVDGFVPFFLVEIVQRLGRLAKRGHVHARRSTKRVPYHVGYHKTARLKQQYKRHPLIVWQYFRSVHRVIWLISANRIRTMRPTSIK